MIKVPPVSFTGTRGYQLCLKDRKQQWAKGREHIPPAEV